MWRASQSKYTWYLDHTPTATLTHSPKDLPSPKTPSGPPSEPPTQTETFNRNEEWYCWQYWQLCSSRHHLLVCILCVQSQTFLWSLWGPCSVVWASYLCELCVHLWSGMLCLPAPLPVSPPQLWFPFLLWRVGWSTDNTTQSLQGRTMARATQVQSKYRYLILFDLCHVYLVHLDECTVQLCIVEIFNIQFVRKGFQINGLRVQNKTNCCLRYFVGRLLPLTTCITFYCMSPMCWNDTCFEGDVD